MKIKVIIPARYQSSRFPGKPLHLLCGVPMIIRVYRQCVKVVDAHNVIIATDDERIQRVCEAESMQVIMTSSTCLTGTDRIAEIMPSIDADVYINVQGDEPVLNPLDLEKIINFSKQHPERIFNGFCAVNSGDQFRSFMIPKVVFRKDGRLMYMSRAPIPTTKKNEWKKAWRQVCIYSFPRKALTDFSGCCKKMELEEIEDIEILRFLDLGWDVWMVPMSDLSISVDSIEDVEAAERAIQERNL